MSITNHVIPTYHSLLPTGQIGQRLGQPLGYLTEEAAELCRILSSQAAKLATGGFRSVFRQHDSDAVLLLCAQTIDNVNVSAETYERAFLLYSRQPKAYDEVLGDLIPTKLQNDVRRAVEADRYRAGTNANVAADLAEFERMNRATCSHQGMPSGLPELDRRLGGLRDFMVIGSEEGTGKTSLLLHMARSLLRARHDVGVILYSLDLPKTRILQRFVCCEAGIDFRLLTAASKTPEEQRSVTEAIDRVRNEIAPRLRVIERDFSLTRLGHDDEAPAIRKGISFDSVLDDCMKFLKVSPVDDIVLMFDLFQKIDPQGTVAAGSATDIYRLDLFDQIRRESRSSTRPNGFTIIATSEIRKDPTRRELRADDLKGDGRICSDADSILLFWPDTPNASSADGVVPLTMRIAKARDGAERGDLQLWFDYRRYRFSNRPFDAAGDVSTTGVPTPARSTVDPLA